MRNFTKTLFMLLIALFSFSTAFAETGTETEKDQKNGNKNTTAEGKSYTIDGSYIAGTGSTKADPMTSKGLKLRTGQNGNTLEFTVRENYTITKFYMAGIANYNSNDPNLPCIRATKVEVDGTEVAFTGGDFTEKGSASAGELTVENIAATQKIVITFDNSNAKGTQLNASWAIDWQRPDATQPTITVTPETVALVPGATFQMSVNVDPNSFTTKWVSSNEAVATVTEDGLVTAVAAGTATISHQWADNAEVAGKAVVTVAEFDASAYQATTIDFTTMGDVELTIEEAAAGAIWNEANNKVNDVYFCTNTGLENIAVQAVLKDGKGWSIVDGQGLTLASGAGRCAAVGKLTAGQIVEIIYTGNGFFTGSKNDAVRKDDGADKTALNQGVGRAIYKMNEDGLLGFEIIKGNAVQKITIYSAAISPLDAAKAALQESINKLKSSALAGKLANEIATAEAALKDENATLESIMAAANALSTSVKTAAVNMLQNAVTLAKLLGADEVADMIAAAEALLAKEDATAEELVGQLTALVAVVKPMAAELLETATLFVNKFGYTQLLPYIADVQTALESGDMEQIQLKLSVLGIYALPVAKEAIEKVKPYAETMAQNIDNAKLVAAITKALQDLNDNNFTVLVTDLKAIIGAFMEDSGAFVQKVQSLTIDDTALGLKLKAALATAAAALSATDLQITSIGAVIQDLVKAYREYMGTVGISSISAESKTTVIYDMQGRTVLNTKKGLYIINGKKVMLK